MTISLSDCSQPRPHCCTPIAPERVHSDQSGGLSRAARNWEKFTIWKSPRRGRKLEVTCKTADSLTEHDSNMANAQTPQDRRVWVRYPGTPETPTYAVSQQDDIIIWKARIRDLSVGGVCLLLNGSFPVGSIVDIEFRNATTKETRTLSAKVVRVTCKDDINWELGCAFVRELNEEEVNTLL